MTRLAGRELCGEADGRSQRFDGESEIAPVRSSRATCNALSRNVAGVCRDGAGNLAEEMVRLAAMLTEADVSAQRTMQLHVQVLEELVGSLGNRRRGT